MAGALWVLDGCLYIQTQEANHGLSLDLNAELPQTSGCHSVPGDCVVSLAPWPSVAIKARGCRGTVDALLIRNMKQRPAETSVQLRAVQRERDLSCTQQKVFFSPDQLCPSAQCLGRITYAARRFLTGNFLFNVFFISGLFLDEILLFSGQRSFAFWET